MSFTLINDVDATKATHQLLRSKSKDKVDAKPDVKAVSL
jgi:hypothetical protein